MDVFPEIMKTQKTDLNNVVIHEICHVISNDFKKLFYDLLHNGLHCTQTTYTKELETMVNDFAMAIESAYTDGLAEGKKRRKK